MDEDELEARAREATDDHPDQVRWDTRQQPTRPQPMKFGDHAAASFPILLVLVLVPPTRSAESVSRSVLEPGLFEDDGRERWTRTSRGICCTSACRQRKVQRHDPLPGSDSVRAAGRARRDERQQPTRPQPMKFGDHAAASFPILLVLVRVPRLRPPESVSRSGPKPEFFEDGGRA